MKIRREGELWFHSVCKRWLRGGRRAARGFFGESSNNVRVSRSQVLNIHGSFLNFSLKLSMAQNLHQQGYTQLSQPVSNLTQSIHPSSKQARWVRKVLRQVVTSSILQFLKKVPTNIFNVKINWPMPSKPVGQIGSCIPT